MHRRSSDAGTGFCCEQPCSSFNSTGEDPAHLPHPPQKRRGRRLALRPPWCQVQEPWAHTLLTQMPGVRTCCAVSDLYTKAASLLCVRAARCTCAMRNKFSMFRNNVRVVQKVLHSANHSWLFSAVFSGNSRARRIIYKRQVVLRARAANHLRLFTEFLLCARCGWRGHNCRASGVQLVVAPHQKAAVELHISKAAADHAASAPRRQFAGAACCIVHPVCCMLHRQLCGGSRQS